MISLIKCKRNQNLIQKFKKQIRIVRKIFTRIIKTISMNNVIISKPLDTMRFQISYFADAFTFRSEMNMALIEAAKLVNRHFKIGEGSIYIFFYRV